MKDFLKTWFLPLLGATVWVSVFVYYGYLYFTGVKFIHQQGWWGERTIYVAPTFYTFVVVGLLTIIVALICNWWLKSMIKKERRKYQ